MGYASTKVVGPINIKLLRNPWRAMSSKLFHSSCVSNQEEAKTITSVRINTETHFDTMKTHTRVMACPHKGSYHGKWNYHPNKEGAWYK